jgi:hypothetical protein
MTRPINGRDCQMGSSGCSRQQSAVMHQKCWANLTRQQHPRQSTARRHPYAKAGLGGVIEIASLVGACGASPDDHGFRSHRQPTVTWCAPLSGKLPPADQNRLLTPEGELSIKGQRRMQATEFSHADWKRLS